MLSQEMGFHGENVVASKAIAMIVVHCIIDCVQIMVKYLAHRLLKK